MLGIPLEEETCLLAKAYLCLSIIWALLSVYFLYTAFTTLNICSLEPKRKNKQIYKHTHFSENSLRKPGAHLVQKRAESKLENWNSKILTMAYIVRCSESCHTSYTANR